MLERVKKLFISFIFLEKFFNFLFVQLSGNHNEARSKRLLGSPQLSLPDVRTGLGRSLGH